MLVAEQSLKHTHRGLRKASILEQQLRRAHISSGIETLARHVEPRESFCEAVRMH